MKPLPREDEKRILAAATQAAQDEGAEPAVQGVPVEGARQGVQQRTRPESLFGHHSERGARVSHVCQCGTTEQGRKPMKPQEI